MSGLSEAEREELWCAAHFVEPMHETGNALFAAVERILAARVASAAADRVAVERVRALADEWAAMGTVSVYESAVELAQLVRAALSVPTEAEGTS